MEKFSNIKRYIKNLKKLGGGWRGQVYKGEFNSKVLTFKIPKNPSFIHLIRKESEILKRINPYGIGGKLEIVGEDFLAYQYIDGIHLNEVINRDNYKNLVFQLFIQGRILDRLGISKDEFHRPYKNVLVDKDLKVHLIDFERAKFTEYPQNITQLIQFVITGGNIFFKNVEKEKLIELAKIYKKAQTEKNFERILNYLNLI